jgi:hypothetical protein
MEILEMTQKFPFLEKAINIKQAMEANEDEKN